MTYAVPMCPDCRDEGVIDECVYCTCDLGHDMAGIEAHQYGPYWPRATVALCNEAYRNVGRGSSRLAIALEMRRLRGAS